MEPRATKGETKTRSVVKSIVWRLLCIVVSIIVSFFLTGNWDIAVAIGTIYNVITMILYYFHERMWNKIAWGIKSPGKKTKNQSLQNYSSNPLKKAKED